MPNPLFYTPSAPTAEQIAAEKQAQLEQVKGRMIASAQRLLESIDRAHRGALDAIWNNGYSTPQEAIDKLGTDAVRLFQGSQATTQFLADQYALAGVSYTPYVFPEGVTITANQDGTVTLS